MRYIEPHAHMVSRTTDDYQSMVVAGCKAVCEPAFWAGFDRSSVNGFYDYFCQLTDYEPKRSAKFGLPHFSWLCINPKESEDLVLAREVIAMIPDFLDRENVLGIGEIGLNKNSRNEHTILEEHVNLAAENNQLILVHTPHLEDKLKGTKLIVDLIKNDSRIDPGRVLIDHVEEHTVKYVMDAGMVDDPREPGEYAGYLSSSGQVGRLLFSMFWGRFSDRHGRKVVLQISLMTTVVTALAFGSR